MKRNEFETLARRASNRKSSELVYYLLENTIKENFNACLWYLDDLPYLFISDKVERDQKSDIHPVWIQITI
ncbi:hypothetical protein AAK979_06545 [Ileibacterium valens]|uniref:hypothetical protein n=1 Tax=Ileibacterium valens TaxID=1862668 RepID=UPI0035176FE2